MLHFLDIFYSILHLSIVVFNVFGWIPKATRKAHFISIVLTAGSWLLLGLWFGIGYCPITDWQWDVKEKRGEENLPSNFIEYFAEKVTGNDLNTQFVTTVVSITFVVVAIISIYLNLILPLLKKRKHLKLKQEN